MTSPVFTFAAAQWGTVDAEFQILRQAEYDTAVEETGGFMVNARGVAAGWDTWRVFTGSTNILAAYASDELRDHLARHPRVRRADFERMWLETWLGEPAW